ncbi:MAG: hypothetical protein AAGF11_28650 [Myxococcota bacterium]
MRTKNKWITALGATALCVGALQLNPQEVTAADHGDFMAPEAAGDIGDFYAWHTEDETIVAIMTFNPNIGAGGDPVYDADRVYTFHIDNTFNPDSTNPAFEDNESDIRIHVRFGQNDADEWGVQVNNAPGADDTTFDGAVDTELTNGSVTAWAGLADDPFFFDLDGFVATVVNLQDPAEPVDWGFDSLLRMPVRDSLADMNAMAIVVEFPYAEAIGDYNYVHMWATTGVAP